MPTVEARVTQLVRKPNSPFVRATLDHPEVKNLESRYPEKIAELKALWDSGDLAVIQYSENSRYDEASQRSYTNRYYESSRTGVPENGGSRTEIPVEQPRGGQGAAPPPRSDIPLEPRSETNPRDAERMAITSGFKLALGMLPHLEDKSFGAQEQVASRYANAILSWRSGIASGSEAQVIDELRAMADDDIPFGEDKLEYGQFPSDF